MTKTNRSSTWSWSHKPDPQKPSGWLIVLMSWVLTGCLQFVPFVPEEQVNNPPYIDPNSIDPQQREVFIPRTQDPAGEKIFRVLKVSDRDRKDQLYAYWFLGYEQFPQGSLRCQQVSPPLTNTSSDPQNIVRDVEFTCRVGHSDLALQTGQSVLLELFVVDREADLTSILNSNGVRKWPEESKWTSYVWLLRVE